MDNEIWLNLSSKDLSRAKEFFKKLGFEINEQHNRTDMVSMFIGKKKTILCLFSEKQFQEFIGGHPINDTRHSNEVLFSLGANSPKEVDEFAKLALEAGGVLYAKPGYKDGWMYGCGFSDLDGHKWNVIYLDFNKIPK